MWAVEMSRTNGACVGLWRTLRGGLLLRFRVLLGLLHRRVERVQLLSGRDTRALWRCQLGAGANAGASHLFCAAMVGEHLRLVAPIHPPRARPPFLASYVKRRPQFWKVLGHTWYGRQPGFPSPPFASDVAAPASVLPASRRVRARRPASSRRVRSARVSVRPSPSVLSRKHGLRSWSFEVGHVFMTWVTNWARVNICLGHQ